MAKLFTTGTQFPSQDSIERLAKYQRMKAIFDGKLPEVYERASQMLKDTPHAEQLSKLYIAVNIIDVLTVKVADMLVGEPPLYESGLPDNSPQQEALNRIVEENDVNQLLHEVTIGAGIRGDAWLKVYYAERQDVSEVPDGLEPPKVAPEPIIEAVPASMVFPELARGSNKRFKAINICWVEHVETKNDEITFLNVERHVPGYILYERYRLYNPRVDNTYEVPITIYDIGEQVATGRENDIVETGVPYPLVFHIPYKTVDDSWEGIGNIEKVESLLAAINDRLVMIDYVIHKNGHPAAYGPDIEGKDGQFRLGGAYIPLTKDDPTPGYMSIDGALDSAFKELDLLIGLVFQISETPQWLFGTTLAGDQRGGTGTSHTDSGAIKARFMPILSKVKRVRVHVDKAIRDALWTAMQLENFANEGVDGFKKYEPIYPKVIWKDGVPRDEKEMAEVMQIRTGGKPTIDVQTAIKKLDEVDDDKAREIISRIADDEKSINGFVDASIFNADDGGGDA